MARRYDCEHLRVQSRGRGRYRGSCSCLCAQAATRPPSFVLFVNDVKLFGDDYKLYMERQIRENVGYPGTPLRLFWRGKAPSAARQKGLVVAA